MPQSVDFDVLLMLNDEFVADVKGALNCFSVFQLRNYITHKVDENEDGEKKREQKYL